MNYKHIKYTENLPFKIYILNAQNQQFHWHKEMELIFLLKGNISIEMKHKIYKIYEKDLFLINRFDIHSIIPNEKENVMLVLQFDPIFFDQYCPEFSTYYYETNKAFEDKSNPFYNKVSSNLAEIMISIIKLKTGYKLKALECIIEIILILIEHFRTEKQNINNNESHKQERISETLNFIEDNYSNDLTLTLLAKKLMLNPNYVSQIFKDTFGITFTEYVNKFRINKSLNTLLTSNKSIIDISIEYGFNDHKAYSRVFKKYYNVTPTEYRSKHINSKTINLNNTYIDDYLEDNSTTYLKYIFEFLENTKDNQHESSNIVDKLNINIDIAKSQKQTLKKYWNTVASVGKAALYLRQEVQKHIKITKKEFGIEYIKISNIFSDELMVYKEDDLGNPIYNWSYIDTIFDFFYEINLKPYVEIGFMPVDLATKKHHNPSWRTNVSYPKSLKKWGNLVSEFIKHCIERYGKDEVEKWYFEIWHAPNFANAFWLENEKSFFKFYKETFFAIKSFSPTFKVGTPGLMPINNFQWVDEFLNYCNNNSIVFDFAASYIYTNFGQPTNSNGQRIIQPSIIESPISNKDFLKDAILYWKEKFNSKVSNNIEFFVSEWNLSPFSNDYNHDTCFLSTYIVYNVLNNINNINCIVFLSLMDIIDNRLSEYKLFHGGIGLFTYNGIKKPAYNAFLLLNKLGNNLIEQGTDYIVTSKNYSYQILIYNYSHFDELYRIGDKSLLSYHNRYNIFDETKKTKSVNIVLSLESGNYRIKRFILNREYGSSFDAWLDMGSPETIQPDIYDYIKSRESPKITVTTESVKKQLILDDSVPVHGILLIEINKI